MEQFLAKLLTAVKAIKIPAITIIFIISLIRISYTAFVGDGDKRSMFSTILMLMTIAALLFYADQLILWIQRITA